MEQATSGQIGQPAACMIENKWNLRADEMPRNYGPRTYFVWRDARCWVNLAQTLFNCSPSTKSVDNFVSK